MNTDSSASQASSSLSDTSSSDATLADTVPIDLAELRQLLDEGGSSAL